MNTSLVVLTDFFDLSNRALTYAAGLAMPLEAHLVLLHLRQDEPLSPDEYRNRHTRKAEQQTTHKLQQLAAKQPVPTEVAISDDFLPDAVQEMVKRHHPLLLVLGRPAPASLPQEIVTSTAMDLQRHAPYPLLIVPEIGVDTMPPRRIVMAVDGEPFHLFENQDVMRRLLLAFQGTLDVVHVTDDDHMRPDNATIRRTMQDTDLLPFLPEIKVHERYHPSIAKGILQEANQQRADLLVVVARRHSLLGGLFHSSITAQLIEESPIPLLILPAKD
ncbi:universal stress protein [Hymenobacter sp. BT188]|uniref:universal stress protein n=1 Tax=Hymenobacter sp. BT188 TaxID=2763504 RepID=UPI00165136FB|nr:universal stress protein [Hymenobacter sp. BT188]MBC6605888.1 universal stress protein [Hymenobacter sp. BT188]